MGAQDLRRRSDPPREIFPTIRLRPRSAPATTLLAEMRTHTGIHLDVYSAPPSPGGPKDHSTPRRTLRCTAGLFPNGPLSPDKNKKRRLTTGVGYCAFALDPRVPRGDVSELAQGSLRSAPYSGVPLVLVGRCLNAAQTSMLACGNGAVGRGIRHALSSKEEQ
jgi:hypothetical protein